MYITGALINAMAILIGSGIGLALAGKVPEKSASGIMRALGLCVCVIGLGGALAGDVLLLVVSMALGTLLGEFLKIDEGLNRLACWAQKKMNRNGARVNFAQGFVTATLLFCVGAMAVVGSIDSGMRGDHSTIITKSLIDAVASVILASTLGVGVLFSAIPVLLYQGSIELFAGALQEVFTSSLIAQLSAIGGVMIFGVGANMAFDMKIKVANFLPGFFVAVGYYALVM